MLNLFEAARSKKLDRIAVGYAVGAWAVVQAASIAAPAYYWPPWILQVVIAVALAGLPITLIGAWTVGVRAETGGTFKPSRADVQVLVALGLLLIVATPVFVWVFWPRSQPAAVVEEASFAAPPNSVAVLPFVNMSGRRDQDYFSDGISEELLDHLSATSTLRVAARMSSFAFKGRNVGIQDVARALHVRAILEGSVRQAGNRVRIAAQLINAADGFGLWSATYDRDLTDILVVQGEIATAITNALARKLGGKNVASGSAPGTIDPEAYRLYLQARDLMHRGNEDDLTKAATLLRSATERAPTYSAAYAALAHALQTLVDRYNKAALLDASENAARQALNLDPRNISALDTLTTVMLDQWQWQPALQMFSKMNAISPNNSTVLNQRAQIAYTFGYPEQDLEASIAAVELNPLSPPLHYNLALSYWNAMRYDEAAGQIHRVQQLRQGRYQDTDMECLTETSRHHLDGARRPQESIASYYAESPQNQLSCPFALALAEGRRNDARKIVDTAAADAEKSGARFLDIADNYRTFGDLKAAMPWYERAYEARDSLLFFTPFEKWQPPELINYPPWKALWARKPIKDWEAARVEAGRILGVVK